MAAPKVTRAEIDGGSLYYLQRFFETGHPNRVGCYFNPDEDMLNATQRNLSTLSDAELLKLRASAYRLIEEIEVTYVEREIDVDDDGTDRVLIVAADAEGRARRLLRDIRGKAVL